MVVGAYILSIPVSIAFFITETLAMKGLFLNHLDSANNATAYDYVKQGLRHDLFSPICMRLP
jgi:hypothetical protein